MENLNLGCFGNTKRCQLIELQGYGKEYHKLLAIQRIYQKISMTTPFRIIILRKF